MQVAVLWVMTQCVVIGKVWKPKEQEKIQIHDDEEVATEWDEVLANATEEELVDLAGLSLEILIEDPSYPPLNSFFLIPDLE